MSFLDLFRKKPDPVEDIVNRNPPKRTFSNSISFSETDLSGGAKVTGGIPGSGVGIHRSGRQIVIDSRNAVHDSVPCKTLVQRTADITVDTGITVRPTPKASIIGIGEAEAERWAEDVHERFHLYLSSRDCVRSRTMNGYAAQHLFMISSLTDNDQFTRFYFENDDEALSTCSFEFIDPLHIPTNYGFTTDGKYSTQDGIERDKRGRETAYHVERVKPNGDCEYIRVPAKSGGRIMMYHGFVPTQISQLRGIGQYSHMLQEFLDYTSFTKSHVDKAIAQAGMAIGIESDSDHAPGNPLGDVLTPAGAPSSIYGSSTLTEEEKESLDDGMKIEVVPEYARRTAGSMAVVMAGGKDKIKSISNTAPVTGYDKFIDTFVSSLAASEGMGIEIALNKFNSNYSASRAALLMFYRKAEMNRRRIDDNFLNPLYFNWLSEEIAAGRIVCVGWQDPVIRAAWLSHDVVGAQVPNIDPGKFAKSNKDNLALGATSLDRISRETNGSNYKANLAKNKRDIPDMPVPYYEQSYSNEIVLEEVEEGNEGNS